MASPPLRGAEKALIAVVAVLVLVFVVMVVDRIAGEPSTDADSTPTAVGTTDPAGGSTPAPEVADLTAVPWSFRMPSGNIGCAVGEEGVVCAIVSFDYAPPQVPGCSADTGVAFGLDTVRTAALCSTGAPEFDGAPELPYGESMAVGEFSCTSSEAGISCSNAAGQEFSLRRADFNL